MFFEGLQIVEGREVRLCDQVERLPLDFRHVNGGNQRLGDVLDHRTKGRGLRPWPQIWQTAFQDHMPMP